MKKVRELISDALYWVSWKLELLADWIRPPFDLSEYDLEAREEFRKKFNDLKPFELAVDDE